MDIEKKFTVQLGKLGIELTENKEQMFEMYYKLILSWNEFINLTAITEKSQMYEKHFLDSLSIVKILDIKKMSEKKEKLERIEEAEGVEEVGREEGVVVGEGGVEEGFRVLDIGTGAGFPGIPLKIVFPEIEMVLLDSLEKRVRFLDKVLKELGMEQISCLHGRAEDFARKEEHRQGFDLVVSRAVANLSVLSEYALPFVKVGGSFVAYKSSDIKEEVEKSERAVEVLGGLIKEEITFHLPGTEICRTLLRIEKVSDTPRKYPRRAGKPEKKPL